MLTAGMHDHPGIYPRLPAREPDAAGRAVYAAIPALGEEGDRWRTCWEFVLTHELTETEGSAFWHGANLAMRAGEIARPLAALQGEERGRCPIPSCMGLAGHESISCHWRVTDEGVWEALST